MAYLLTDALVTPGQVPLQMVKAQNELLGQFGEAAFTHGNLAALRQLHQQLRTFAEWV